MREGEKGEEEGVVEVWGESGREGDFLSRPLSCRVGGFGLPVFSKGGGRGASWRHIRVKLMNGEGEGKIDERERTIEQ